MDAQRDRTELRLRLFANGFEPLPDKDKMCLIKDWPTLDITPDLIRSREWARSREYLNTGIRCGNVVAVDLDIDDKTLLNELADAIVENGVIEESEFVRIGRPPRELWVYRIDTPIGKRTTGGFAPGGTTDENAPKATVEVLGKGSQFAAFGRHPKGFDYEWPVKSPLDHRYAALPKVTADQITRLIDFCAAFFEEHGLLRVSAAGLTEGHYSRVFDLTPDMIFNVKDLGRLTLAQIEQRLQASPEEVLRCTMEGLRPATGGSWAGMISLVQGAVCISDHGDYTAHFPAVLDNAAPLTRLGQLLAARMAPTEEEIAARINREIVPGLDPNAPIDTNIDIALKRYVYVKEDDMVRDIVDNSKGYPLRHFQSLLAQYWRTERGPRGGEKMTMLSDLFMRAPTRINVATAEMRPDKPYPIYRNGELHYNTWRPVELPTTGGDPEPGFRLIENLLPRRAERAWFLQWLAHKVRHPAIRGPGVVMVASNTFGTGRGSLISLMTDMLGENYVRRIDFDTLTGRNYQSQYNDWMANSLLIAVDEAQESSHDRSRWQARQNAYERIKSVVDPNNARVQINRKGVDNYQGTTFASLFVATNHADALVIPANDRRLAVLENGQPMPTDYWAAFHAWRESPNNIGAFIHALGSIDIRSYDPYAAPPMTAIKAEMIDAGTSDLDRAIGAVLQRAPGGLMVREQLVLLLEDFMASNSVDFPDEWRQAAGRIFVRMTRKTPTEWVTYDGKNRQLRQLRALPETVFASEKTVLDELHKNGPAERTTNGKVVQFPRERA